MTAGLAGNVIAQVPEPFNHICARDRALGLIHAGVQRPTCLPIVELSFSRDWQRTDTKARLLEDNHRSLLQRRFDSGKIRRQKR